MTTAFVFPGQGAQQVGMIKDLYDNLEVVKKTVEEANDILGVNIAKIMFEGPEDDLSSTENTQPALFVSSSAILNYILSKDKKITDLCSVMAGHSLGEYSALYAAGSLSFSDGVKITRIRGRAMQEACPIGYGSMAACINVSLSELEQIISKQNLGICEVANDNTDSQKVISGECVAVEYVIQKLKEVGKKAIKLQVSAAFHSSLMKPAAEVMKQALGAIDIRIPQVDIVGNLTASKYNSVEEIKTCLINQVSGRVRWRETINYMEAQGVTRIVEIGSGSVLTNMLRRDNRNFELISINNLDSLEKFCQAN